jgi:uncharacterized membrane protein
MHLIPTNAAHIHLLVSVFPSVGLMFALGLFVAAMKTNNALMQRLGFFAIGGLGVLGIPTYLSGDIVQKGLAGRPHVSPDAAAYHLGWAYVALASMAFTGLMAFWFLYRSWKLAGPTKNQQHLVLGFGLFTLLTMAIVGEIGWEIAHWELFLPRPEDGTSQVWSHIHIILNHLPTVGFVFGLYFFIAGILKANDVMKRSGLVVFVMCAILAASTYVTGTAAMWALTDPPNTLISQVRINQHRDFAIFSLLGLAFTGGLSWFELWRYRYLGRFSKVSTYLVLVFAALTFLVLAETGHLGGQINHPEIREAGEVIPTDPMKFIGPQVELLINTITWFVPWQTVHFFGYTLIFATVLVVSLRIWGVWKGMSFSAVHRILPLGAFGVLMNIFSGMLMMMADAHRYLNEFAFWPKMFFLPIGAITVLYYSLSDRLWAVKAGDDAPMLAKWVAVLVFVSWTTVIAGGRLLPYLLP